MILKIDLDIVVLALMSMTLANWENKPLYYKKFEKAYSPVIANEFSPFQS